LPNKIALFLIEEKKMALVQNGHPDGSGLGLYVAKLLKAMMVKSHFLVYVALRIGM
jgi:hypothetical protein